MTLIEDITQEASSKPLPALPGRVPREQLRESSGAAFPDATFSGASPYASTGICVQKVQGPASQARAAYRPCLRYNSTLPRTCRHRKASPTAAIECPPSQPRPACSRKSCLQETDPALVSELHQGAQKAVGPSARNSDSTPGQLQSQMQPRFFGWSEHLLGIAVPKPRPLTRPPPRSLVYRPPTPPLADRIKPLGLITVKDLPSRQQATSESRPRQSSKPPAPQVPTAGPGGLVSRAS